MTCEFLICFEITATRMNNMHDKQSSECDICIKSKMTKKTCSVELQTELLGLTHTDLDDLNKPSLEEVKIIF